MKILFFSLLCLLLLVVSCTERIHFMKKEVIPEYAEILSKNDIHKLNGKKIAPYIYRKVISLQKLPVKEKKQKFIDMLLPAILMAQHDLNQEIARIEHIEKWLQKHNQMLQSDSLYLYQLFDQYKCSEIDELKMRLKPHPASIVLGQAALESGWGSSRFFVEANNIFGIWSYHNGEERIKALVGRDSTHIYVRKYANIEESIKDYYQTIARVRAYREFRLKRTETNDAYILVPFLFRYSELGEEYTRKLSRLIRNNHLTKYDKYSIDKKYIQTKRIELATIEKFSIN